MSRFERKERAKRILNNLDALREAWTVENAPANNSKIDPVLSRRERFKVLEAGTAILRLLQAESRLMQQIVLGLGGFVSGSMVTLLLKHWLPV